MGGGARTLGVVGRLGGVGARPEVTGLNRPSHHLRIRLRSSRCESPINGGRPQGRSGVCSCGSDSSRTVVIRMRPVSPDSGATVWCAGCPSTSSTSSR
ncbi:hypothetical protein ACWCQM_02910 [Streptomyces sp. NPDC002125]